MAATSQGRLGSQARTFRNDAVLNAVGDLLADRPWAKVSMAEVAEHAGVSRQTVYNAFGSRDELARAYIRQEADAFLGTVEAIFTDHADDPRRAIQPALEMFLAAVENHPLVRAIGAGEGDELLALLTARGEPLIGEFGERLSTSIRKAWPNVPKRSADLVADSFVRLAISHAALPAASPKQTSAAIAEVLAPYIAETLGLE
jgi:AcrR family transcriptional regulator